MDDFFRMDSWKDISGYLRRSVKTCCTWEKKFGLPVHRIDPESIRSRVFAFKDEIDAWLKKRNYKY